MTYSSKWDGRFMDMAALLATWSKDPSTKVGAVIVDNSRRVIGSGYNGFPRGVKDDEIRYLEKNVKYKLIVHSESNAMMNAVSSVRDATLYTTKFPCTDCSKQIIQNGIYRIVSPPPSAEGVWHEDAQFSLQMLKEACVSISIWDIEKRTWISVEGPPAFKRRDC